MPTERTLSEPLTGDEIRIAVLKQIENTLRRDCFLNSTTAYRYFNADISYKITLSDAPGDLVVERQHTIADGSAPPADADLTTYEVEDHIDPMPPNEVRVETGQGVPTLTRDSRGKPVVKKVQYASKKDKKVAQPVGA